MRCSDVRINGIGVAGAVSSGLLNEGSLGDSKRFLSIIYYY